MQSGSVSPEIAHSSPQNWALRPIFNARTVGLVILALLFLSYSAHRMQLDDLFGRLAGMAVNAASSGSSDAAEASADSVFERMFPLAIAERTPIDRIADFDPDALPLFAHLETVPDEVSTLDPDTLQMTTQTAEKTVLVEPVGYLFLVIRKIVETLEIALWASLIAVIMSLPLAWLSARNYSPHWVFYAAARSGVSFLRAVPELISALFLVLAFGFATLRLAVLPQVLPSYAALTLYVLDRNVRMATVIGLVGAGGIGQELKGRFDMFQYDRVGTILLVIFITVLLLDQLAARIRKKLL